MSGEDADKCKQTATSNSKVCFTAKTGMNVPMTEDRNCARYLELFVTNEIGGLIVSKTNRYAEQFLAWHTLSQKKWKELTLEELNVFLTIIKNQKFLCIGRKEQFYKSQSLQTPQVRTVEYCCALFHASKFTVRSLLYRNMITTTSMCLSCHCFVNFEGTFSAPEHPDLGTHHGAKQ